MYKINDAKMFYDMTDGQAVIIDFTSGMYYGSNLLGSAVIDRLAAGKAPSEIAKAVKRLPGCPADMDARIDAFVKELLNKEIMTEGETAGGGDEDLEEQAASDGFELSLNEFAEMQDLIMADPIHEVNENEGWPILKKDHE